MLFRSGADGAARGDAPEREEDAAALMIAAARRLGFLEGGARSPRAGDGAARKGWPRSLFEGDPILRDNRKTRWRGRQGEATGTDGGVGALVGRDGVWSKFIRSELVDRGPSNPSSLTLVPSPPTGTQDDGIAKILAGDSA